MLGIVLVFGMEFLLNLHNNCGEVGSFRILILQMGRLEGVKSPAKGNTASKRWNWNLICLLLKDFV